MKVRVIMAAILAAAASAPAPAQTTTCPAAAADACQKAIDVLNFLTPQLSTALVGGNPTLGQGGGLGGLGHFSFDVRGTLVNVSVPLLSGVNVSAVRTPSNFSTENKNYLVPSFDLGVGLWRGYSLGVTHVGGVDAIVTMTYFRNFTTSGQTGGASNTGSVTVTGSNAKLGYGLRLGILEESAVTPGISVAWAQRGLPTMTFNGTVGASGSTPGGTLALKDFAVNTTVWRVTAAKSFLIFGLSAGYGQDRYSATSTISGTVSGTFGGTGAEADNFSMTRTNYFVGAFTNLFIFKLEAELGRVSGGSVPTYNTFDPAASAGRNYLTVGLRFGL